jgi:hypothetical protein
VSAGPPPTLFWSRYVAVTEARRCTTSVFIASGVVPSEFVSAIVEIPFVLKRSQQVASPLTSVRPWHPATATPFPVKLTDPERRPEPDVSTVTPLSGRLCLTGLAMTALTSSTLFACSPLMNHALRRFQLHSRRSSLTLQDQTVSW